MDRLPQGTPLHARTPRVLTRRNGAPRRWRVPRGAGPLAGVHEPPPGAYARMACWRTRRSYITYVLRRLLELPRTREVLARHGIDPDTFARWARIEARSADRATGRDVRVRPDTVGDRAGMSERPILPGIALRLLFVLALQPEAVSRNALREIAGIDDEDIFETAISDLLQLTLIEHEPGRDAFSILPLTRRYIRSQFAGDRTFIRQADEAMNFYLSIFKNSRVLSVTPGPDGRTMSVNFELEGQEFIGLNAGPRFKFNEAISFFVDCETQAEVDELWEKLTADGGEESRFPLFRLAFQPEDCLILKKHDRRRGQAQRHHFPRHSLGSLAQRPPKGGRPLLLKWRVTSGKWQVTGFRHSARLGLSSFGLWTLDFGPNL